MLVCVKRNAIHKIEKTEEPCFMSGAAVRSTTEHARQRGHLFVRRHADRFAVWQLAMLEGSRATDFFNCGAKNKCPYSYHKCNGGKAIEKNLAI